MNISNQSNVTYTAAIPDKPATLDRAASNTVHTEVLTYAIAKTIQCDKNSVKAGETAHITVTVTNNSSATLDPTFTANPTPDGASFVAGSVRVNGAIQPDLDPVKGFSLPDLDPAERAVIEYDMRINAPITATTVPIYATLGYTVHDPKRGNASYAENTDTLFVRVISDKIDVVKSVDKRFAVSGETLHYTVTIANKGSVPKSDLVLKDPLPVGTAFVAGSVKINGIGYAVYHPEIGFALQSLAPDAAMTVEFDVKVD